MSVIVNASTSTGLGITSDNSGSIVFQTNGTDSAAVVSGNLQFNSGYGSIATAYGCRAWVNFNGIGTVAIRASGNVSSITDNGTGDYTINFTNAMVDTNYTIVGTCMGGTTGSNYALFGLKNASTNNTKTTTTAQITVGYISSTAGGGALLDHDQISVAIFR
jgi:hypothetical protein